jgi:hypothetical protein
MVFFFFFFDDREPEAFAQLAVRAGIEGIVVVVVTILAELYR